MSPFNSLDGSDLYNRHWACSEHKLIQNLRHVHPWGSMDMVIQLFIHVYWSRYAVWLSWWWANRPHPSPLCMLIIIYCWIKVISDIVSEETPLNVWAGDLLRDASALWLGVGSASILSEPCLHISLMSCHSTFIVVLMLVSLNVNIWLGWVLRRHGNWNRLSCWMLLLSYRKGWWLGLRLGSHTSSNRIRLDSDMVIPILSRVDPWAPLGSSKVSEDGLAAVKIAILCLTSSCVHFANNTQAKFDISTCQPLR